MSECNLKLLPTEPTGPATHDLRPWVRLLGIFILMETVAWLISDSQIKLTSLFLISPEISKEEKSNCKQTGLYIGNM